METLKKFIGPPLHESFMEFYGFSKEQAFEAVDRYRVRYKEKGVYENRLYPGMKELLEALKGVGVKLSVSTSKPTVFTEKILKQNGIFELFDQIVGANLDGSMTDKTEVMQEAMRRAGGKENNTFFMVGDRSFDMIGAKLRRAGRWRVFRFCGTRRAGRSGRGLHRGDHERTENIADEACDGSRELKSVDTPFVFDRM